ncbi:bone morphogenetic protein receptor type-1A-like [Glossina fuscipes fuscipes]
MIGALLSGDILEHTTKENSTFRNLTCYCDGDCPDNMINSSCLTRPGGYCFTAIVQNEVTKRNEFIYGCMPPRQNGGWWMCLPKNVTCCDIDDYCNQNLTIKIPTISNESTHDTVYTIPIIIIIILSFIVLTVIFPLLIRKKKVTLCVESFSSGDERTNQSGGPERFMTRLKQRSIADEIQLENVIGRGKYGHIFLGYWRNEKVAVKVFREEEKASWEYEADVYKTVLLPHENILGYIASDISCSQMFLITEYYENGSLYDLLSNDIIETDQLQLLALSLMLGLSHLHKEIVGNPGKPGIAHRNIKSKNILVKNNTQCCLSDFGLAVKYHSNESGIQAKGDMQVGTARYMAPEILNKALNQEIFEEYKQADMYAVSLVLWEMAHRCRILNTDTKAIIFNDYALPYYDEVPEDPSIDVMRIAVCDQGLRPIISASWQENNILSTLSKVMEECWKPNPAARLTALRAKKTIQRLDGDLTDPSMEIV